MGLRWKKSPRLLVKVKRGAQRRKTWRVSHCISLTETQSQGLASEGSPQTRMPGGYEGKPVQGIDSPQKPVTLNRNWNIRIRKHGKKLLQRTRVLSL